MKTVIHWFRRDLRVSDNTALAEAARRAENVIPVFIFEDAFRTGPDVGAALAKPEDRGAGVDVTFTLPRGSHAVALGVVEADGKTIHLLDPPLHIVSQ